MSLYRFASIFAIVLGLSSQAWPAPPVCSGAVAAAPGRALVLEGPEGPSRAVARRPSAVVAAELALQPRLRFSFPDSIPVDSLFVPPELSEDGSKILLLQPSTQGRGVSDVAVHDVASGREIWRAPMGSVRHARFVAGRDAIVVTASPRGQNRAVARVVELAPERRLPAAQDPLARADVLRLPESLHYGASVQQMIGRADLPYLLVIRDSANTEETMRRPGLPVGVDPNWARPQIGGTLLNAGSLQPLRDLRFGQLVPQRGLLNPRSSLLALQLTNPFGGPEEPTVVVVDARDPDVVLFQQSFGPNGTLRFSAGGQEIQLRKTIALAWSDDGARLLAFEKASGSYVEWDAGARTVASSDIREESRAWPILGASPLRGGGAVIARASLEDALRPYDRAERILSGFAFQAGEPRDFDRRPTFEAALSFDFIDPRRFSGIARSGHVVQSPSHVFEMRGGRACVFVFGRHILAVDVQDPSRTAAISLPDASDGRANAVMSVRKIDEETLRIADLLSGGYDLAIP